MNSENYKLETRPTLDHKFKKLLKKHRLMCEIALRKAEEILNQPQHYKNLSGPMKHLKRVHVDSNFVLTYSVYEGTKTVVLEDLDHHDRIYQK